MSDATINSTSTADQTGTTPPAGTPPAATPAAPPAAPAAVPPEQPADTEKKGTPEDVKKRLDRAKAQGANDLAKSLGYDNAEAMKAALEKAKGAGGSGSTQSELDAVKAQLLKLTELAERSQQEAESLKAQRRSEAVTGHLKTVVKGMRLKDTIAEDMLALAALQKRDVSKLVKEDLTPDPEAITALINDMRTARPEWFKTAGPGSPSALLGTPTEADEKKKQAAAEAQWRALKRG